jgi:hypothetical protein
MNRDTIKAQNDNLTKNNSLEKVENTLLELTKAVTAQKDYLEKQTAAMEKLTQAVKQLELTLKKEIHKESRQSSSELDELIKLFVEYDINPQFYHEHKMLKSAPEPQPQPEPQPGQLVRRKHRNSRNE